MENISRPHASTQAETHPSECSGRSITPSLTHADVMNYFNKLSSQNLNISSFTKNWNRMAELNLNARQITHALSCSAKAISHAGAQQKSLALEFMQGEKIRRYLLNQESLKTLKFKAELLKDFIWSFATLKLRPSDEIMGRWYNNAHKQRNCFYPSSLTTSLWSLARLGLNPDSRFLKSWCKSALRNIDQFSASDISLSAWSLAVLSSVSGHDILDETAEKFILSGKVGSSDQHVSISQINLAAIWFGYTDVCLRKSNRQENSSKRERQLRDAFINAGYQVMPKEESYLSSLDRYPDIHILDNDRNIIIEYDGPPHFVLGLDGYHYYDGGTKLQNALAAKLYPDHVMIRINYMDAEQLLLQGGYHSAVESLAGLFATTATGVYETAIDHNGLGVISALKTLDGPA